MSGVGLGLADLLKILFALGLPLLTGALFVCAVWPGWRRGGWALLLGLGFPLGLVGVVAGYILLDRMGVGLQFAPNVGLQLGLAAVLLPLVWWRLRADIPVASVSSFAREWTDLPVLWRWVCGGLLAWLAVRWLGITLDVWLRPLQPWDAWYAYGVQAKVWFHEQRLDVLGGGWRWFYAEEPIWPAGGTRHPPGIGLIQLWLLQAIGRWDDALMNLAWPLGLLSAGGILFGLMRLAGGGLLAALVVVWVLFSLPMVVTPVLLAGYGDFWVGLYVLVALAGIWLMRVDRAFGPLLMTAVAGAGMLLLKQSGAFWLPALALGFVAAWVRPRWIIAAALLGLVGGLAWIFFQDSAVPIARIGRFGWVDGELVWPDTYPMWGALVRHLFEYPNWHLLWYLVPVALGSGLWMGLKRPALRAVAVAVCTGLAMLVLAFAFSGLGNAVIEGTSVNRLLLHGVPGLCLLIGLVAVQLTEGFANRTQVTRV